MDQIKGSSGRFWGYMRGYSEVVIARGSIPLKEGQYGSKSLSRIVSSLSGQFAVPLGSYFGHASPTSNFSNGEIIKSQKLLVELTFKPAIN